MSFICLVSNFLNHGFTSALRSPKRDHLLDSFSLSFDHLFVCHHVKNSVHSILLLVRRYLSPRCGHEGNRSSQWHSSGWRQSVLLSMSGSVLSKTQMRRIRLVSKEADMMPMSDSIVSTACCMQPRNLDDECGLLNPPEHTSGSLGDIPWDQFWSVFIHTLAWWSQWPKVINLK